MEHSNYHNYTVSILSIILLVIGVSIRYIIGRRRFNRRGVAGLPHFKSYEAALLTTYIERFLNIIGTLMIIAAIILYLIR
ncbi:hypothetical protein [Mucilaginibacter gossypii]|uniref:Molybdenum ABC transporter permease n=1 Tax=Mucilaginibacter gossypii TaxID=551996 RepID=A0A1G8CX53_9SPHI|nr:hypothetical protein [Mucilaginibacter gossypii]SDH50035.1 hypothetical protein SAMN05192573_11064 [Mucilaginibacter gossypii]